MCHYKRSTILAAAILLGTAACAVQADNKNSPSIFLRFAYRAMDEAAAHQDVNKVLSYDSPDFTATSVNRKVMSLAQQRHITQIMLGTARMASSTTQIRQIKILGKTAIVLAARHYDFTMAVFDQDTGKYDHYVNDTIQRDKWTRSGRGWIRRSSQGLCFRATRNGQPLAHHV